MFRNCSVCSAPREVLEVINRGLSNKIKLRVLAEQSGLSKSAIHRHSQKCVARQTLNAFKASRFNPQLGRVFVQMPDDPAAPAELRGKLVPSYRKMTRDDVLILVSYAPPGDYLGDFDEHGRYVRTTLELHEHALRENASRDAAKEIRSETEPQPVVGPD